MMGLPSPSKNRGENNQSCRRVLLAIETALHIQRTLVNACILVGLFNRNTGTTVAVSFKRVGFSFGLLREGLLRLICLHQPNVIQQNVLNIKIKNNRFDSELLILCARRLCSVLLVVCSVWRLLLIRV